MATLTIAERKHRLTLFRAEDIVINGSSIVLKKEAIYKGWGKIEAKTPSTFAPQGVSVEENVAKHNHIISMNFRPDILVATAAWVYEERLKSPPRLFKILSVIETCDLFKFYCRLTERGDNAILPVAPEERKPSAFDPIVPKVGR
jgi:hypothetical protein